MFKNPTVIAAILNRLVHHSHIIKITSEPYRLTPTIWPPKKDIFKPPFSYIFDRY
ncbi:ATP-binding protein [Levilactobacillus cerevisiae]|uniref:ATP-binding protein n=1 Tax=Levilactobacillus cerevisiae TaxID=1704076 RepID=UPI001CDD125C|nr:ATP-binding protein [Levilactobacillus cerevisiae]